MADDPKSGDLSPKKEVPQPQHADVIEAWFRDHFTGSASLAATTEAYNAAYAAKEDLKTRLAR